MAAHAFDFCGEELVLLPCNAMYWPRENALLVADLHLEKGSFYARHGQMLPPYDSRETLSRVADALKQTGARRVYTLGDNFHDARGAERLEEHAAGMLDALVRATDWVWVTGNHDHNSADRTAAPGGTELEELEIAGMILRHEAKRGETRPELSGHYHPKLRLKVRARHIARPCAVVSQDEAGSGRMILPAFGAYTGGMDAGDPAILDALQPAANITAMVAAKTKLTRFPLWRATP
ncbi:MAG: ligase-associated DNA damage response endonuclease PdeM [Marinomonas sp.]